MDTIEEMLTDLVKRGYYSTLYFRSIRPEVEPNWSIGIYKVGSEWPARMSYSSPCAYEDGATPLEATRKGYEAIAEREMLGEGAWQLEKSAIRLNKALSKW